MSSNASFGLRDQYVDRWFGDVAEEREQLFSLVYGGRRLSSKDLPFSSSRTDCPGWELLEVCCQVDPGVLEFVLSVRIYKDFPNVEVAFRVRNVGEAASGLIEELRTLDFQFKVPPHKLPSGRVDSATALIRYNLGATTDVWDFLSLKHRLYSRAVANRFVLEATEGRPSANFLPFFGVDGDGDLGVNVGIGWGGAWRSEFELFCHGQAKPSTCRITGFDAEDSIRRLARRGIDSGRGFSSVPGRRERSGRAESASSLHVASPFSAGSFGSGDPRPHFTGHLGWHAGPGDAGQDRYHPAASPSVRSLLD